jgi:Ca2+/Na+ antiporter
MKILQIFLYSPIIPVLLIILFGPPIFLSAGTLNFWNGWLFLLLFAICSIFISIVNLELAEKRAKGIEEENSQMIV